MENKQKLVRLGIVAVALGVFAWGVKHFHGGEQGPDGHMVQVSVLTLKPQDVQLYRDLPGRVQAHKVAEVRPQVTGIILKQIFEEGSLVKAGAPLYQIDPATFDAAYESALAALEKAKAALVTNQAKAVRYKELLPVGGVSHQDYDDAVAAASQSKADVAVAKAAVKSAKINLDYTKMYAPISGRIGRSFVTQGALVSANQTDALAVIQGLDKVYVDVMASLADMAILRTGGATDPSQERFATVTLETASAPLELKGRVAFEDVSVDPGTGSLVIRLHFSNADARLLPGMFVRARLNAPLQKGMLLVPQRTLARLSDGTTQVWCVGEGDKVRAQKVVVGHEVGTNWIVTSGLKAGDRVVVEGIPKLKPDMVVKAVEDPSFGQGSASQTQKPGA